MTTTPAPTGHDNIDDLVETAMKFLRYGDGYDHRRNLAKDLVQLVPSLTRQLADAERERDAAREELAKTRAELDAGRAAIAKVRSYIARHWADEPAADCEVGVCNCLRFVRDALAAEANPATTAEPADEQDDESLFESHRLADGTMPDTIPVSDPEHDAPDGATIDGYTRQRNTWVRNAEPAAG